jgi:hypothetical protein
MTAIIAAASTLLFEGYRRWFGIVIAAGIDAAIFKLVFASLCACLLNFGEAQLILRSDEVGQVRKNHLVLFPAVR